MNVRVAVLRNQTELSLRCICGEYVIESASGSEKLRNGEEQFFSQPTGSRTVWCKRTQMENAPFNDAFSTGIEGTTKAGFITSRRWLRLESSAQPESPDPLFAQAIAIARSESHDSELFYRDERPHSNPVLVMGYKNTAAPIVLKPITEESEIKIFGIRVGIGFHWDSRQDLTYRGAIELHALADGLCAVVETPLDEYLAVVNSSEMPADLPLEFLKAQTVAARSWLLANLGTHHPGAPFDVCSDDHCQCYHGSIKRKPSSVQAAIETAGQILVTTDNNRVRRITDARYAKTCGGRFEPGHRIWGGETPGLVYLHDNVSDATIATISNEQEATAIINDTTIDDYCNPHRHPYPPSLAYCAPFYRWQRKIPLSELTNWIQRSTGKEIGVVQSVQPLERGPSGRLHRILITGTADAIEIKGELAIRRALSDSHLPSSAFVASFTTTSCNLTGAGWGHGAGLCQSGAAVRATLGQTYREILLAYYPTSQIEEFITLQR